MKFFKPHVHEALAKRIENAFEGLQLIRLKPEGGSGRYDRALIIDKKGRGGRLEYVLNLEVEKKPGAETMRYAVKERRAFRTLEDLMDLIAALPPGERPTRFLIH